MTSDLDFKWQDATAPDYRRRLMQFECAQILIPDTPHSVKDKGNWYYPWQLEVQKHVRGRLKQARNMRHEIIVDNDGQINGYVFYGYFKPATALNDDKSFYTVGFIARALRTKGCRFGHTLLKRALSQMYMMQEENPERSDIIITHIHKMNKESQRLFASFGFECEGEAAWNDYQEWVRVGFDL